MAQTEVEGHASPVRYPQQEKRLRHQFGVGLFGFLEEAKYVGLQGLVRLDVPVWVGGTRLPLVAFAPAESGVVEADGGDARERELVCVVLVSIADIISVARTTP